jgi:hypothetical protein
LNGKTVVLMSDNFDKYVYAWMSLNTSDRYRKDVLAESVCVRDDHTAAFDDPPNNPGFQWRKNLIDASRERELFGTFPLDICNSNRWLPPGVEIKIALIHADDSVRLQKQDTMVDSYAVTVTNAALHVVRITAGPELLTSIQHQFANGNRARGKIESFIFFFTARLATYFYKRLIAFGPDSIPDGLTSYRRTLTYTIKPSALLFWFQESSRVLSNDQKKNSQKYTHANVKSARVTFETEVYPRWRIT